MANYFLNIVVEFLICLFFTKWVPESICGLRGAAGGGLQCQDRSQNLGVVENVLQSFIYGLRLLEFR